MFSGSGAGKKNKKKEGGTYSVPGRVFGKLGGKKKTKKRKEVPIPNLGLE